MAVTQQTVLNQRELTSDGIINIRLALQVMNGDSLVTSQWHRCSILPGMDPDVVIAAVNADIAQEGRGAWPAISDDDAAKIRASCAAEQTPDVIAAYRASQAAAQG